jgi:hypothetical protein
MLGAAPASATVLLDLVNPPNRTDTPFSATVTATMSSTVVSVAGWRLALSGQSEHPLAL